MHKDDDVSYAKGRLCYFPSLEHFPLLLTSVYPNTTQAAHISSGSSAQAKSYHNSAGVCCSFRNIIG